MNKIDGGVCAAKGFQASGIHCGIRKNRTKRDLALIVSDRPASAAAVYTTNLVKGAPLEVTRRNLEDGKARVIICNSGNANTCNADGIEIAEKMCALTAAGLKIETTDVVASSFEHVAREIGLFRIVLNQHSDGVRHEGAYRSRRRRLYRLHPQARSQVRDDPPLPEPRITPALGAPSLKNCRRRPHP